MNKSERGIWALVFFILTGLVGLALIGFGVWMLIGPSRFDGSAITPTVVAPDTASDLSRAIIITATVKFTLSAQTEPNPNSSTSMPGRPSEQGVTPTIQPVGSEGESSDACPGSYPSHLRVGQRAMVSLIPPLPNNVRERAAETAKFLFAIQPGELVDVIEGPGCANGWVWWKIQTANGQSGWTAEGDGKDYWLVAVK
ncbi:MAG TPA: SH3 domain-containing protein [Anaerolineaceae bacterium]|nr:SH3 domain-containing protein [Anaerolineaceae bacterium]